MNDSEDMAIGSLDPRDDDPADDPRVLSVIEEYMREVDAGRQPDRQAYANRYPQLAGTIRDCLEGLDLVHPGPGQHQARAAANLAVTEGFRSLPLDPGVESSPLGDFQIVGEIARGGMGIVYEAVQLSLGRRVALKVLPFAATVDPRHLQRFKIEAQAAALLHHTHIVPIYAVGCERGVHFYAMQLIAGQSLATVIDQLRQREGRTVVPPGPTASQSAPALAIGSRPERANAEPAPSSVDVSSLMTAGTSRSQDAYLRRVARLLVQAAEALDHAHQAGVIHRDIKPANLLIDAGGNLWVTDFGLAQLQADTGLTRSGDFLGTFRYMSPEQMGGQRTLLDHRTDIYSLGATFYELLALEPVYGGQTHQELLYQILHTEPRRLRDANRSVPAELETIIHKALSKSSAERYATAAEMAADVQRFLDHQPIRARPPSLIDRTRKWLQRHPSIAVAGVLLLLVVAVGALISNRLISAEQGRTQDALAREQIRAREAEERFQQSRQAVDALFQISEEELAERPFEGARKRILEIVLSHYEDFVEQRQGDAASQAELAAVQSKVKQILHELDVMQREMHLRLLESEAVQADLQLTSEQQTQLAPLLAQWMEQVRELIGELSQHSEDEKRRQMAAAAEQHEAELRKLLSAAQLARLRQISIQAQGPFAFKDTEIIRALGITAEQRAKIRDVERRFFGGPFGGGGPPDRGGPSFSGGPPGRGGPGGFELGGPDRGGPAGSGGPGWPGFDDPGREGPGGFRSGGSKNGRPGPPGGMRPPPDDAFRRFGGPGRGGRPGRDQRQAVELILTLLSEPQRQKWDELIGPTFTGLEEGWFPVPPPFGGGGPPIR